MRHEVATHFCPMQRFGNLDKTITAFALKGQIKTYRHVTIIIKIIYSYYFSCKKQSLHNPQKGKKKLVCLYESNYKKMTFKEEYLLFLKEYDIDYDEDYLWAD